MLGNLSSINQGIKTQLYEQVKFIINLENNINKIIKFDEFNKLFKKDTDYNELNTKLKQIISYEDYINLEKQFKGRTEVFTIDEFLNDPVKKQLYFKLFSYFTPTNNILTIIDSVPHFKEMIKAFNINNLVLDEVTWKHSEILKISKILKKYNIAQLDKKTNDYIEKFLSECLINDYLNTI